MDGNNQALGHHTHALETEVLVALEHQLQVLHGAYDLQEMDHNS